VRTSNILGLIQHVGKLPPFLLIEQAMLVKFSFRFHLFFFLRNVLNAAEVIKKRGVEEILKQATLGIGESAHGRTRKTPKVSKLKAQTQRGENRSHGASLISKSSGL
jgi:hypothetical protein